MKYLLTALIALTCTSNQPLTDALPVTDTCSRAVTCRVAGLTRDLSISSVAHTHLLVARADDEEEEDEEEEETEKEKKKEKKKKKKEKKKEKKKGKQKGSEEKGEESAKKSPPETESKSPSPVQEESQPASEKQQSAAPAQVPQRPVPEVATNPSPPLVQLPQWLGTSNTAQQASTVPAEAPEPAHTPAQAQTPAPAPAQIYPLINLGSLFNSQPGNQPLAGSVFHLLGLRR
ncbi:hypothetical protein IWQ61_006274 [Dispira simplex]|nr:hypothetical protein IWQ61_006274 [Dispira simplex]